MSALHRFFTEEIPANEIVEVTQQANAELIAMQKGVDKLVEYPERLQKAITELEALHPFTFADKSRIAAKIEGVKLALSYFEEMTR